MTNKIVESESKINLTVDIIFVKEENYFVAYCPALELSAYGDTLEKAKTSFDEEIKIFLSETRSKGTLEKYLLKNGWRLQQLPKVNYEPPIPKMDKLSALIKSSVFHQQLSIPVY